MKFIFEVDLEQEGQLRKAAALATMMTLAAKQLLEVVPPWADIRSPLLDHPEFDEAIFMESLSKNSPEAFVGEEVMAMRTYIVRESFDTISRMHNNPGGTVTTTDAIVTVHRDGTSEVEVGDPIEVSKH